MIRSKLNEKRFLSGIILFPTIVLVLSGCTLYCTALLTAGWVRPSIFAFSITAIPNYFTAQYQTELVAIVGRAWYATHHRNLNVYAERHNSFSRDLKGLPVPAEIVVYSLPEWKQLEKKDTKFARILKSETVWTFLKQTWFYAAL